LAPSERVFAACVVLLGFLEARSSWILELSGVTSLTRAIACYISRSTCVGILRAKKILPPASSFRGVSSLELYVEKKKSVALPLEG
jgi:hypothetical protein